MFDEKESNTNRADINIKQRFHCSHRLQSLFRLLSVACRRLFVSVSNFFELSHITNFLVKITNIFMLMYVSVLSRYVLG